MKKIIVCTDFSACSKNAIRISKKIASKLDAEILLLHSFVPPFITPDIPVNFFEATYEKQINDIEKELKKESANKLGLTITYKIVYSDLISAIKNIEGADLIVIGKTGHNNLLNRIFGSITKSVLNSVEIPILIIPDGFKRNIFGKVGYFSKLEYHETQAIENTLKLLDNDSKVLEIYNFKDIYELNIVPNQTLIEEIKTEFGNKIKVVNVKSRSFTSEAAEFIEKKNLSLVSLSTHKKFLFERLLNPSKAISILEKIDIPIFISTLKRWE